jgi:hypothetical protein
VTGPVTVDEIRVADEPSAWASAGFTVEGDLCRIGSVRVRLLGRDAGRGAVGWSLRGVPASSYDGLAESGLDGLPTTVSHEAPCEPAEHALGMTHLDHVVLMSPHLDRTRAALAGLGLEERRVRDAEMMGAPMRQVFYRLGEVVLELVGSPDAHDEGPTTIWGLTHCVPDLDAAAARLGDGAGRVKDAVQPGRRITTLRGRELGISVATALMSPPAPLSGG